MSEEAKNEQQHFVVSSNFLYSMLFVAFGMGAGGGGTLQEWVQTGEPGQCPDNSAVALSLSEGNRQAIADIRNLLSKSDSTYYKEDEARSNTERQEHRDSGQDRTIKVGEREYKLHLERFHSGSIQSDK